MLLKHALSTLLYSFHLIKGHFIYLPLTKSSLSTSWLPTEPTLCLPGPVSGGSSVIPPVFLRCSAQQMPKSAELPPCAQLKRLAFRAGFA